MKNMENQPEGFYPEADYSPKEITSKGKISLWVGLVIIAGCIAVDLISPADKIYFGRLLAVCAVGLLLERTLRHIYDVGYNDAKNKFKN